MGTETERRERGRERGTVRGRERERGRGTVRTLIPMVPS